YFVPIANLLIRNKVKLIFTEHNTSNNRIDNVILRKIDSFFYKKFKKQICISSEIKQIFQKAYNFPEAFCTIIENGVNLESIKNAVPINKSLLLDNLLVQDKIIVLVSAFREQKDQDTVIKALLNLPENFKLILIGDGIRREVCENLVSNLGLNDRVKFLGQRMDVPQIMKAVDYIVLSSK